MYQFLSGIILMGCCFAAAFFLRFWLRTRDRFFLMFAGAWMLLALERLLLVIINAPEGTSAAIYFVRLGAFLLIIAAIIEKNRVST
jgi:hypothetical protein